MKRFTAIILVFLMAFAFVSCKSDNGGNRVSGDDTLHSVSKRSDIINVINDFNSRSTNSYDKSESPAAPAEDSGSELTYSKTNVQVGGVDEGDIVKVDGSSIYKLSQNGFVIINVDNGAMEVACKIERENYVPLEMYVNGDSLIMIGGIYDYYSYYGSRYIEPAVDCCMWIGYSKTEISVYDISDKQNPALKRSITVDGNFNSSRMVGDKIYYVLNYYFYYGYTESYIPKIKDSALNGGAEKEMNLSDIHYFNSIPMYAYLIMGCIDVQDTAQSINKAYLGGYGEIYVNQDNIFVASQDYSLCYQNSYDFSKARTRILKFKTATLEYLGTGRVGGTIKDRYSIDEYNGYLRIATTTSWWDSRSNSFNSLYVLDSSLNTVGKIEKFAQNETIYSVRFNKDKCTIVTFEMVDPLFTIDLSNPLKPTIKSELKEDGVSYYLHYVDNSDYIIGLGVDSQVINNRVTWKGLKVSLYKEVDEETVNLHTVTIGSAWSYAEALYNARAILADFESYNLFGFASEVWDSSNFNDFYGYQLKNQAFYVFSIDYEKEQLEYNVLSNFDGGLSYSYANPYYWYDWYDNQFSYIKRGVAVGNYIYTISDRYITSYSLNGFVEIQKLEIAKFTSAKELFG